MLRLGRIITGMVAAGVAATASLKAQNMPMGGQHMMDSATWAMMPQLMYLMPGLQGMMQEMMAVHAYDPATVLEKKTDLGLTAAQVKSLEALASEVKLANEHALAEHNVRHARIIAEFKLAKPDPAKVKADAQAAMADMGAAHAVQFSAMARAKGILTAAQQAKVEAMMDRFTRH